MRRIKEAIVVEGKYDVVRVRSAVQALVIATDGFGIFHDAEKTTLLRRLAAERGLIVLTDSDSAGTVIRNRLLQLLPAAQVRLAYTPPIPGKERRKPPPPVRGCWGWRAWTMPPFWQHWNGRRHLPGGGRARPG